MACDAAMYNPDQHKPLCPPMSPRISFSNDFADSSLSPYRHDRSSPAATAASSDFEFSVTSYSMMSADELFSKGRLLPFKDSHAPPQKTTTLREELLAGDADDNVVSLRPPKGSGSGSGSGSGPRWRKGLLGLRRTHIASKKPDKSGSDGPGEGSAAPARLSNNTTSSQGFWTNEGLSCGDEESGFY